MGDGEASTSSGFHAALVQTAGNQRYVFDTNKRRENVGASELIVLLGSRWTTDAMAASGVDRRTARLESEGAEVVLASAGGVVALFSDEGRARDFVTSVTLAALREAPGLDVCGAVSQAPRSWTEIGSLQAALEEVYALLPDVRARRPGPDLRFLRVPIVAECDTSGLPAAALRHEGSGEVREQLRLSPPSLARHDARRDAVRRLAGLADTGADEVGRVVDYLADVAEWTGVIHADGNGIGALFEDFHGHLASARGDAPDNRAHADALRGFSQALDQAAAAEYRAAASEVTAAVAALRERRRGGLRIPDTPLLPLVLGGDDLTVLCDGPFAMCFAVSYLRAFERTASRDADLLPIAQAAGRVPFTARAGVAIVKRHFPFSAAYELADDLAAEAKTASERAGSRCSSLSFHVLYDSAAFRLEEVQERLIVHQHEAADDAATRTTPSVSLRGQPYVVTAAEQLGQADAVERDWVRRHHLDRLIERSRALRARDTDSGRRVLASSQTHAVRQGLFLSLQVAEARFASLRRRYGSPAVAPLEDPIEEGRLFWNEQRDDPWGGPPERTAVTGFLDAMDINELMEGVA